MPEGQLPASSPRVVRWLKGFGVFWWDFLVGDTPELFIGVLVAIGLVTLLVKAASFNTAAVIVFPLVVVAVLGGSVYRARRGRR